MTAKVPLKVHLRLRFQNLGKPRTAGLCGRAAGACDCGPLSCAKIERPSPSNKSGLKSSVFRPKPFPQLSPKSYRHNAVPNRFSSRFSTSRTNGPRLPSLPKAGTHSALGERSHTAAHTAKHGAIRVGVVSLPSDRSARFGNPAWPGIRTASFAAFGAWSGAPKERRKPSEQRCAYARRCSEASRPRWAAQPLLWSSWLSCFCLKPLLQTALRHGTMVSPNRKP